MRLVCPACGAVASAEAWANDATAREFQDVAMKMPGPVQHLVLPYLGLFRSGKGGLSWSRALRILRDLRDLVEPGSVHWEGAETRPAPAHLWAQALDAVLARRPKALTNHNYLRHTAWEMAGGLAADAESGIERRRRAKSPGSGEAASVEDLLARSLPGATAKRARRIRSRRPPTTGLGRPPSPATSARSSSFRGFAGSRKTT